MRKLFQGAGLVGGVAILVLLPWVAWQVGGIANLVWLLVLLVGLPLIRYGDQYFYNRQREGRREKLEQAEDD